MSAGKRYKYHGSTIELLTGFDADSPSIVISGITQANPAVATATGHGITGYAVGKLSGIVGMTELNDVVVVAEVIDANSLRLIGINSTGYGVYSSGGVLDVASWANFCENYNYNRQGGAAAEMDATSLCSTAKEFEVDLPDFGTTQLDYNFAPRTTIQDKFAEYDVSKEMMGIRVTLPNGGGEMVQLGFVQQTSETAGRGTLWTGSTTIRNSGARYDVAAS